MSSNFNARLVGAAATGALAAPLISLSPQTGLAIATCVCTTKELADKIFTYLKGKTPDHSRNVDKDFALRFCNGLFVVNAALNGYIIHTYLKRVGSTLPLFNAYIFGFASDWMGKCIERAYILYKLYS